MNILKVDTCVLRSDIKMRVLWVEFYLFYFIYVYPKYTHAYVYVCIFTYECGYTHTNICLYSIDYHWRKVRKVSKIAVKFHFCDLDNTGEWKIRKSRNLIKFSFDN